MVVVFPAPFGPSSPKHSPSLNFQIQPAHGFDYFAVISLAQVTALDGGWHKGILPDEPPHSGLCAVDCRGSDKLAGRVSASNWRESTRPTLALALTSQNYC